MADQRHATFTITYIHRHTSPYNMAATRHDTSTITHQHGVTHPHHHLTTTSLYNMAPDTINNYMAAKRNHTFTINNIHGVPRAANDHKHIRHPTTWTPKHQQYQPTQKIPKHSTHSKHAFFREECIQLAQLRLDSTGYYNNNLTIKSRALTNNLGPITHLGW
jgi:hypothetical protein